MTELNTFPVIREDFEGRKDDLAKKGDKWIMKEIGKAMGEIKFGDGAQLNLWELVHSIDGGDLYMYTPEEDQLMRVIRDSMCIHKYMYEKVIGPKVGAVNPPATANPSDTKSRALYANTHAMFVAVGYARAKLEDLVKKTNEARPSNIKKDEFKFMIQDTPTLMRQYALGKIAVDLKDGKEKKTLIDGVDVSNLMGVMLNKIEDILLVEKDKYRMLKNIDGRGTVMEDFENTVFDIDGVKFKGFTYEAQRMEKPKLEFKRVEEHEVVGNILAKKHMLRDVQRLLLFNFKERKNPILEFGPYLNWSTLLDGLPGTGKTTMMQMEMTRLMDFCEALKLPYHFWVIDSSSKDPYYGKTQEKYRNQLNQTTDPTAVHLVYFDDVDLIIPSRFSPSMNSADQDVLKLFMDYLAGVYTIFRGNTIVRAATNSASSLDDAFRQRFKGRYLIDGPTTAEDCAKLMMIKFAKPSKQGLVNVATGKLDPAKVAEEYKHVLSQETKEILSNMKRKAGAVTWADIGEMCYQYQQIDKRFTGRFMDNVVSNVIISSADFDLDKKIFEDRAVYLEKPYQEQVEILKPYFGKIEPELIVNELDRYFQSEMRYFNDDRNRKVDARIEELKVNAEANAWIAGNENNVVEKIRKLGVRQITPDDKK